MKRPKTIVIPIFFGMTLRNVLRTELGARLKAAGHRLVLVSPLADDPEFVREFDSDQTPVYPGYMYHPGWLARRLRDAQKVAFQNLSPMHAMLTKQHELRRRNARKYWFNHRVLARLLGQSPARLRSLMGASVRLHPLRPYRDLIERYQPDLLLSTHCFLWHEQPLLAACRSAGVPMISFIHSWDNITTKGNMPVRFDGLLVWNEILKREILRYYSHDAYRDGQIHVVGIPQFDYYLDPSRRTSREAFCAAMGLDPGKKLITYTTCPERISPDDPALVERVGELIRQGRFGEPVTMLVRLHPYDRPQRYEGIRREHIVFDSPGRFTDVLGDKWYPSAEDMDRYADTLAHSDVVVNVASTTTIDSCAFDTPVVNIAIDARPPADPGMSVKRYYQYEHYRGIVASGGVAVADTWDDLVAQVDRYLADPSCDRAGRRQIVREQCWRQDGQSGRRAADVVLSYLDDAAPVGRATHSSRGHG